MSKTNLEKFEIALQALGDDTGSRCAPNNGREHKGDPFPDDAYVMAAAIGMTLLVQLRGLAYTKALSGKNIQQVIDGFFPAAQVEETYTPMGALIYERKPQPGSGKLATNESLEQA